MPRLSKIGAAALAAFGWTGGASVTASYLVVAGGGGGSGGNGAGSNNNGAGGAGAGGFRTGTASLNLTQSYTVTVGAGGVGGTGDGSPDTGTNGSDSIFSSITSTGGGRGGSRGAVGQTGGSGSGGAGGNGSNRGAIAGGAGNTPSTSPSQGNNGGSGWEGANLSQLNQGGGGGGAGAVGSNATSGVAGAGGAGATSAISGTTTYYAGGGGGGATNLGTAGAGTSSTGGGGAGSNSNTAATSGTANLGGGGGGGGGNATAGSNGGKGGSGVVIISYPAPQKFGGGVVTTSGSNVIHTFNTSGTLSPLSSLTASYLIVAGGGGSGTDGGGGGGAGGFLTGSGLTLDSNSIYLVTVGAGGAKEVSGTSSSIGVVTSTATGGGFGGGQFNGSAGATGGSGGGGRGWNGNIAAGAAGTAGQGTAGASGGVAGGSASGGGGGGATSAGAAGTSTQAGAGGAGTASSITGTSVTYAGGGGGGGYPAGGTAVGAGGAGGGGAGGGNSGAGVAGTANTGGGAGGGGGGGGVGVAGGSGVVIISYAGATQQMAGGTVTITGGNVIHTFTSSGYLTPIKLVNNSLRFRSSASAYLNRTFKTPTSGTTWTWSGWVKRGILTAGTGTAQQLFSAGSATAFFRFSTTDTLISGWTGATNLETTAVYRDPAAWYHIMLVVDTTQATSSNRVKYYVNGVQITAFSTTDYPTQNSTTTINSAVAHNIGAYQSASQFFDGYMTEINFVDGQALTPNSFGTFNSYGVWQPITYGGSYGINGFYLPFTNTTSATTLAYDFSPNGNNWTPNNISTTAGVTYDSMKDVPTLTSATAANYCVLNPLACGSYITLSSANLQATGSATDQAVVSSTMQITTPSYWECTVITKDGGGNFPRFGAISTFPTNFNGTFIASATTGGVAYRGNGDVVKNSNVAVGTYTALAASDVLGFALDPTNQTCAIYLNNVLKVTVTGITAPYFPAVESYTTSGVGVVNFGQRPFSYTPPTGFVALNTYNL
jgi:hypothetical protein